uniref:Uncharacterized protein n=1 Tax=Fagus sylvatica TaxID=28930 RepID=A0A2N9EHN0_FAGSY
MGNDTLRPSSFTVNVVVKKGFDAVNGDGVGGVDVRLGDGRVVEGEVGGRGVGDENGFGCEESGEASVGVEVLEF